MFLLLISSTVRFFSANLLEFLVILVDFLLASFLGFVFFAVVCVTVDGRNDDLIKKKTHTHTAVVNKSTRQGLVVQRADDIIQKIKCSPDLYIFIR